MMSVFKNIKWSSFLIGVVAVFALSHFMARKQKTKANSKY